MKILIISNIPSPYRIDFFNALGKKVELTVIFEAKTAKGIKFNWNLEAVKWFEAIFLREGDIQENKINWNILQFIKKYQYDVIIITNYAYLTEMIAMLTLKFKRIPYYIEIDGGFIRKECKLKKAYKTFLISNAQGYLSPSKSSDDYLVNYGAVREKIYRYPYTSLNNEDILQDIIKKEDKEKLRKELNINENKVVLAVGQFIHRKGFDVLLSACKELKKDVGIYFIGGNPTKQYLKLKDDLGLSNVYFEGFKTKEELSKYFKAADLFVLPTREDVWGLVINEAMGYGLPVVTTDKCVAGLELIKDNHNGFIVPIEEEKILAEKINAILNDEAIRNNMSTNNLQSINEYTIKKMANAHIRIFESLQGARL